MEGYNSSGSYYLTSCKSTSRSWVSFPMVAPKRIPLVDAMSMADDPCHPPGRCFPCRKPVPKFRLHRKFGGCDKCTLAEIEEEKKVTESEECAEKWRHYEQMSRQPAVELGYNPSQPVEFQVEAPPEGYCKEMKYKTNIVAGFFNLDDNKSWEERYKEY